MKKKLKDKELTHVQFLKFIDHKCIGIYHHSMDLNCLREIKELTENIKFDCQFVKGKCVRARECAISSGLLEEGCCCSNCKNVFGYNRKIDVDYISDYRKAWRTESGFFEKGKGCRLPRKLRSSTCVGYACDYVSNKLTPLERNVLSLIRGYV